MLRISRRAALKTALLGGAVALGATSTRVSAEETVEAPADAVGLLYDATMCIGCKACVVACGEAAGLPADTGSSGGLYMAPDDLNAGTRNIIKLYKSRDDVSYVKRQCMHCVDPACVSACMMGALKKREYGIVTWQGEKCVGCRYCQIACPYNIPKFEWTTTSAVYNPRIIKCELCHERLAEGKEPACTEVCPRHAVIYGKRADLLKEAKKRLAENPDLYVQTVYGEHEGGGTQVLYISHVPFDSLGLPALSAEPVPAMVRKVQGTIYKGFIAPVALYGVLATVINRNTTKDDAETEARS
jgi:Fe-S-cluster-containing dehydrogenase component